MLLNPIAAPTSAFTRITEDPYGAVTTASLGDCQVVVSIGKATAANSDSSPGASQVGVVFVPRGLDRREGDRFTYNSETYELMGQARGNQDHPFTGDDFGWVEFGIRRVTP